MQSSTFYIYWFIIRGLLSIIKDIGFLISKGIIAIDQAAIDLILKQEHNFFVNMGLNPEEQTKTGEKIGMGSREYELI